MHLAHAGSTTTTRRRFAAAFMLFLFTAVAMPGMVAAQEADSDGPGTEFRTCRETAFLNYDICRRNADGWSAKLGCYMAWDLDNVGCDMALAAPVIEFFAGLR